MNTFEACWLTCFKQNILNEMEVTNSNMNPVSLVRLYYVHQGEYRKYQGDINYRHTYFSLKLSTLKHMNWLHVSPSITTSTLPNKLIDINRVSNVSAGLKGYQYFIGCKCARLSLAPTWDRPYGTDQSILPIPPPLPNYLTSRGNSLLLKK